MHQQDSNGTHHWQTTDSETLALIINHSSIASVPHATAAASDAIYTNGVIL